jgi:hypothetical protein
MIDGTFNISMKTPMGMQEGTITFNPNGDKFTGTIVVFKKTTEMNGIISGNSFEIDANIKIILGSTKSHVTGTVDGDNLTAMADTTYGKMSITGTRA